MSSVPKNRSSFPTKANKPGVSSKRRALPRHPGGYLKAEKGAQDERALEDAYARGDHAAFIEAWTALDRIADARSDKSAKPSVVKPAQEPSQQDMSSTPAVEEVYWPEEKRELPPLDKPGVTGQYRWFREVKEFLGHKDPRDGTDIDWANVMRWPNGNICFPLPKKSKYMSASPGDVDEFVAQGGVIKTLLKYKFSKVSKNWTKLNGLPRIVYSQREDALFGQKYVDALRKRAKKDPKAQDDLDWFRYRALPMPYVPKEELACEAHSIRSNIPWDFEDRFLDSLGEEPILGDFIEEDYADDCCSDETFRPSIWVHDLVKPDFTQSLNRLFGQEVDERRLTKESLGKRPVPIGDDGNDAVVKYRWIKADERLRDAWKAFGPTWNGALAGIRRERQTARAQPLRKRPS